MPTAVRNRLTVDPHRIVGLSATRVNRRKQRQTDFHLLLARADLNLTQIAARSGLSQSYVSRIVAGTRTPSLKSTVDLARSLGLTLPEMASILLPGEVLP